jgi:serine/threonine protein phosphatase 1
MEKTFVIADIHGCCQSLLELLDYIKPDPLSDRLIFLGDYIDRGPQSREVVNEVINLKKKFPKIITLMGNHEQMLLEFLQNRDKGIFLKYGGRETLKSYGISPPFNQNTADLIPAEHLDFINSLDTYWEDNDYIYVHAGLEPGINLSRQSKQWCLWGREKFIKSDYDFGKTVIFGHTDRKQPLITTNKIGIDTGAVYGGRLTCLVLPDREFISVPDYQKSADSEEMTA